MREPVDDRLKHRSAGIMMKLPDTVDSPIEGRLTPQLWVNAKPGPQTKEIQPVQPAPMLVQRAARCVGIQPPLLSRRLTRLPSASRSVGNTA